MSAPRVGWNTPAPCVGGPLSSVRLLHNAELGTVSADAVWLALMDTPEERAARLAPAWQGAEAALLAYGIAACRELEHRRDLPGSSPRPTVKDHRSAIFAAGLIVKALRERHDTGKVSVVRRSCVPRVLVRYTEPSWWSATNRELYARHRAALLHGPNRGWYVAQGLVDPKVTTAQHGQWYEEQLHLVADTALPPHDPKAPVVRWQLDTAKDWGERLVEKQYTPRRKR